LTLYLLLLLIFTIFYSKSSDTFVRFLDFFLISVDIHFYTLALSRLVSLSQVFDLVALVSTVINLIL